MVKRGGKVQQKIRSAFTLVEGPANHYWFTLKKIVLSAAIAETTLAVIVLRELRARYPVVLPQAHG
jgi:hypothetical protein